jgi:dTDP-glucose 4,6-dehydratase
MRYLVTGGAGFIGFALVRHLVALGAERVAVVDKLTYAANPAALAWFQRQPTVTFHRADIADRAAMGALLEVEQPDALLHLAAESHVDRSIESPLAFLETNVMGTAALLDAALAWWRALPAARRERFRFLAVSTDEVYGTLAPEDPAFSEATPFRPNSPYAASKAAADHLARAWARTYGLPVIVTNCSNNYGPYHFPEKLIPLTILNALEGKRLPVYGQGDNVRDWLYVEDHAAALVAILQRGRPGETYNVGGGNEVENLVLVGQLCARLDRLAPRGDGRPHASAVAHVADRPGHDRRYAIDDSKLRREIGFVPPTDFASGLTRTVEWYLANRDWLAGLRRERYGGERLGLARRA